MREFSKQICIGDDAVCLNLLLQKTVLKGEKVKRIFFCGQSILSGTI